MMRYLVKNMNLGFLLIAIFCSGQSIRKNHLELTETEKINLVNGLYQLRTGPDLINDLSNFHGNYFSFDNTLDPDGLSIHLNLPDRPENDIFFPWHRMMVFELEQALQDLNPNISVPYWDSSADQSVNSSLWDENFLGQFDEDWSLGRNLGADPALPTSAEVDRVQAITDFLDYSNQVERFPTHTGAHRWTGGIMTTPFSPRDPIFYFHHNWVDKLWDEWEEIHQNSAYVRTSMLRYDGTYNFNGENLSLVNPNDILDSKTLGVFFAENQLVTLENYTVNNTFRSLENFYYQYTIEAGNNFIVPSIGNCKFESVNEIILQPGFEVAGGGTFLATIDSQVNRTSISKRGREIIRNQIPFDDVGALNVVSFYYNNDFNNLQLYPNPFSDKINIRFTQNVVFAKVKLYDVMGRSVLNREFRNITLIKLADLSTLSSGIYIIQILDQNNNYLFSSKIVKL